MGLTKSPFEEGGGDSIIRNMGVRRALMIFHHLPQLELVTTFSNILAQVFSFRKELESRTI